MTKSMYDLAIDHALSTLARGEVVKMDTLRYLFGPAACKAADDLVYEGLCSKAFDGITAYLYPTLRYLDSKHAPTKKG